jgi:hypothetical protein
VAKRTRIMLWAARQEPAPLGKPQDRSAGPSLQARNFLFF